ncbi:TRAF4 [Cordylochernes scorpioides]|uniref:TRAF4 n=1 Tax=Cordylochernes scorpioides TaxID=51811 RepID=A0ABY6JXL4_9ARAC|nr:TRAF4 [Cordylochernes scorpioides]
MVWQQQRGNNSTTTCIHTQEGCRWTGEPGRLQAHLNTTCRLEAAPCPRLCAALIPRALLEDHLRYTCPQRRARCEACGATDLTAFMLEDHAATCQYEPVYCENKCGAKVQRRAMSKHRNTECTKRLVACRYCTKEFVFDTLQIVDTCVVQNHTAKCPRYLVPCPNHCEATKIPREDLDSHLKDHCTAVILSCAFKDMGCRFKGTWQTLDQHQDDQHKSHLVMLCNLVSRQQSQISALRSALHHLSLNTTGTLVWRIPEVSLRMADKDGYEIRSPIFSTSQYGYRMMATVFLNGNGPGEGTHVSVYIKLMPGDFDSLLKWPFSHPVSFTLYDQTHEKPCHISESFVPDPSWHNFQRPSKEPDALGFGFPRFVSHETLKKRNYIKDDTLFIKVKVDSSKIVSL